MASIRERKGKFNVIYNYKDDSGKRKQKWETYDTKDVYKRQGIYITIIAGANDKNRGR